MSDEFEIYYRSYLDNHYPNDRCPSDDSPYSHNRDFYTLKAYERAFGQREDSWNPMFGFNQNENFIRKLYEYYKNLYNQNSFSFLWAGLGRMAGGAVTGGLQKAAFLFQDQTFTTKAMVLIGKAIFLDMAWQHEIFLADQQMAINMALENDARYHPIKSYAEAWKNIACQDQDKISEGNKMLLEIEQYNIIQPIYDKITEIGGPTVHHIVTALSSNIHPYHRPFLFVIPTGNVMNFNDRWRWITEQQGMWEKWIIMPSEERDRLINTVSLDDLIIHNWGPTIPELLPHGALF